MPDHPPRAQLAFRVGVVGHRPNRLPTDERGLEALRTALHRLLHSIKQQVSTFSDRDRNSPAHLYSLQQPKLSAVSSLAEGTDRIFASEALSLGYELLCPFPFHQAEYENDFLPDKALVENSLQEFRGLLQQASTQTSLTTYELDGQRSATGEAYGMAGRVLLNQSDLLVVVWDGEKAAGTGGTPDTLHEAIRFHLPVIVLDPFNPDQWRFVASAQDIAAVSAKTDLHSATPAPSSSSRDEQLQQIIFKELVPPQRPDKDHQITHLSPKDYFHEKSHRFNVWVTWKIFRNLLGSARLRTLFVRANDDDAKWPVQDMPTGTAAEENLSAAVTRSSFSATEHWINRRLGPHYAWPDKLANWYADHYRSAYIAIYLLSAFGVLTALAGHAHWWAAAIELALVVTIVRLVSRGSKRHWHERWIEYRLLAELVRQIRITIPLGGARPLPRTPLLSGNLRDISDTWLHWHIRALARAIGIPSATITREYLTDYLAYMSDLVEDQMIFHRNTAQTYERIYETLHSLASSLFLVSMFFITIRLVALFSHEYMPNSSDHLPSVISAFLIVIAAIWYRSVRFVLLTACIALLLGIASYRSFETVQELFLVLAVLPAFGAALTGIANQGEFAKLAKRSVGMENAFGQLNGRLGELKIRLLSEVPSSSMLANAIDLSTEITQLMVDDVSDWRVVVAAQPMRLT